MNPWVAFIGLAGLVGIAALVGSYLGVWLAHRVHRKTVREIVELVLMSKENP